MQEPIIFWEDFQIGEVVQYGAYRVAREEMLELAREFKHLLACNAVGAILDNFANLEILPKDDRFLHRSRLTLWRATPLICETKVHHIAVPHYIILTFQSH